MVHEEMMLCSDVGNGGNNVEAKCLGNKGIVRALGVWLAATAHISSLQSTRVCRNSCNKVIPKAYTSLFFENVIGGPDPPALGLECNGGELGDT